MSIKTLDRPIENFRIELSSAGGSKGVLLMAWEKTEASIPITVQK